MIEKLYYQDEIQETLNDNSKMLPYLARKQRPSSVIHWGQLKLFLSTPAMYAIAKPAQHKPKVHAHFNFASSIRFTNSLQ